MGGAIQTCRIANMARRNGGIIKGDGVMFKMPSGDIPAPPIINSTGSAQIQEQAGPQENVAWFVSTLQRDEPELSDQKDDGSNSKLIDSRDIFTERYHEPLPEYYHEPLRKYYHQSLTDNPVFLIGQLAPQSKPRQDASLDTGSSRPPRPDQTTWKVRKPGKTPKLKRKSLPPPSPEVFIYLP